jgi:hypothetical protein
MAGCQSVAKWLLLSFAATAYAICGGSIFATAAEVGVAAAVQPEAFSVLDGGARREVRIGNRIVYNERINTSGQGLVQILLVDGSTFTVGPGSDLVIDKFVYDPQKQQGELVASFSIRRWQALQEPGWRYG